MAGDAATHYDFSEYPIGHPLYSTVNHKAIRFFKDELNSVPMQKFVGLSPKYYAFLCTGNVCNNMLQHTNPVEKKTAKGVKRRVKDADLHFEYYLDAHKNFHTYLCRQNLIKSTLHTVGLTAYDTKRWLCDDTIHTQAHGHMVYLSLLYLPHTQPRTQPHTPTPIPPSLPWMQLREPFHICWLLNCLLLLLGSRKD